LQKRLLNDYKNFLFIIIKLIIRLIISFDVINIFFKQKVNNINISQVLKIINCLLSLFWIFCFNLTNKLLYFVNRYKY
jgi:hypothetical protein